MLAAYLDHTNLKPEAARSDIESLCHEAVKYGMAAVCVHPGRLVNALSIISGSPVRLCTVIGFPLGADTAATKLFAARNALDQGADELDMVINIGAIKDNNYSLVKQEINSLLELKPEYDFLLKVIVETALLTSAELAAVTTLVSESGADFIKTSTGFASRGVSLQDIEIIKQYKSDRLKIKASGGIRELEFALRLLEAGVDRIGTSSGAGLVEEYRKRGGR
ncbi:MAG: deoxyribose-phosphate aldolase [Deltaproteobacteria bacterium]